MARARFSDGIQALDAKATRARLAEAIAAVREHPHRYGCSTIVQEVEGDLLAASRQAIRNLDFALWMADRLQELSVRKP